MTESGYLARRRARLAESRRKALAIFGIGGGLIIASICGFRAVYSMTAHGQIWAAFSAAGALLFLVGLVCPDLLERIEAFVAIIGQALGRIVIRFLVATVYLLLVFPIGAAMRFAGGRSPFYEWESGGGDPRIEGWIARDTTSFERTAAGTGATSTILQSFFVISYFVHRRQYLLLPALLLLLVLGLLLFFVQSSSLAPFIYTLF